MINDYVTRALGIFCLIIDESASLFYGDDTNGSITTF